MGVDLRKVSVTPLKNCIVLALNLWLCAHEGDLYPRAPFYSYFGDSFTMLLRTVLLPQLPKDLVLPGQQP